MTTGKCPKCGGTEIHVAPPKGYRSSIPYTPVKSAALDEYVCLGCGYVESYIKDLGKLKETLAKKWPKAES